MRAFQQVDVFTATPYLGNPVAVVLDGTGLNDDDMLGFAQWTNLSETTFLLPPTDPAADYRLRIFTPGGELPFAGHPTIGSCHAWLGGGGQPRSADSIIQECGVGLVTLRRVGGRLAFAAPPLMRSGAVEEADVNWACRVLGVERDAVLDAQWADNGPGWLALQLADADAVLALTPDYGAVGTDALQDGGVAPLGVVGLSGQTPIAIEVRAFIKSGGATIEDPVTGSLNAALAQWLLGSRRLESPYVAAQGTAMGRAGRVFVEAVDDEIWVGGDAITCIEGEVAL